MEYPDGTAVIRYYPVEITEGSFFTNSDAVIGLGLWVSDTGFNPGKSTMASVDGDPLEWTHDGGFWFVSSLAIPITAPGGYTERAFLLVTEDNEVVPITPASIPLQLFVSRDTNGVGGYAGGVIQIGLYQSGAFISLCSFQLAGSYFPVDQVAPGGWEALPAVVPGSIDTEVNPPVVNLVGDLPIPLFWTQIKQAVEV